MKVNIEIEIPEGLDLEHCTQAVYDALYLPENVTQLEYDFVLRLLDRVSSSVKAADKNHA